MLVGLRDFAASCDFVANPDNQDAGEKDEEGGENQPRELHSNHGAVEGRRSEPHWNSTKPQAASGLLEGKKLSFFRKAIASRSSAESPEDLSGTACKTCPSDERAIRKTAESSGVLESL